MRRDRGSNPVKRKRFASTSLNAGERHHGWKKVLWCLLERCSLMFEFSSFPSSERELRKGLEDDLVFYSVRSTSDFRFASGFGDFNFLRVRNETAINYRKIVPRLDSKIIGRETWAAGPEENARNLLEVIENPTKCGSRCTACTGTLLHSLDSDRGAGVAEGEVLSTR